MKKTVCALLLLCLALAVLAAGHASAEQIDLHQQIAALETNQAKLNMQRADLIQRLEMWTAEAQALRDSGAQDVAARLADAEANIESIRAEIASIEASIAENGAMLELTREEQEISQLLSPSKEETKQILEAPSLIETQTAIARPSSALDPEVERAARDALDQKTGDLLDGDLAAVTWLELRALTPRIAENLSLFPALERISLWLPGEALRLEETAEAFRTLSALPGLKCLRLFAALSVREALDLSALSVMRQLTDLSIFMDHAEDANPLAYMTLDPLAALTGLTQLSLNGNLDDLTPLAALTGLKTLELHGMGYDFGIDSAYEYIRPSLDLAVLENLASLETLDIYFADVRNISALWPLKRLTTLSLGMSSLQPEALSELSGLTSLTSLTFNESAVGDLKWLSGLTGLTRLSLCDDSIRDISPLAPLTALRALWLDLNCIYDLTPLKSMTKLESLSLDENHVYDLSPLLGLSSLKYVCIGSNPLLYREQVTRLSDSGCAVEPESPLFWDINEEYECYMCGFRLNAAGAGDALVFVDARIERAVLAALKRAKGPVYAWEVSGLLALDLRGLGLSDLTDLKWLTSLETLDLRDNQIVDVSPLRGLVRLIVLRLDGNLITDVSALDALDNLRDLSLDDNPLTARSQPAKSLADVISVLTPAPAPAPSPYVPPLKETLEASADAFDALPELQSVRAVPKKGMLALYSAPSKASARMANGKAAVSTNAAVYLYGTADGWTMLHYAVTSGADNGHRRVGYVKGRLTKTALTLARVDATITADCALTDDPVSFDRTVRAMDAGERVTALARLNGYIYIETTISKKITRGFVPQSCILLD